MFSFLQRMTVDVSVHLDLTLRGSDSRSDVSANVSEASA